MKVKVNGLGVFEVAECTETRCKALIRGHRIRSGGGSVRHAGRARGGRPAIDLLPDRLQRQRCEHARRGLESPQGLGNTSNMLEIGGAPSRAANLDRWCDARLLVPLALLAAAHATTSAGQEDRSDSEIKGAKEIVLEQRRR